MGILAGIAVVLSGVVGFALTLLGFSGVWLAIVVALLVEWRRPDSFSMWTIGVAIGLALLGEVAEFVASALGASKAGGTKRAAGGAILGGFVGAIVGTPIAPIVGTILGAAVGAGVGAALMHQTREGVHWKESMRVAQGAAVGRLVATVIKAALAAAVAIMLSIAAFS